jgi:glycosyltransferase involved in cell wall biosynthesis
VAGRGADGLLDRLALVPLCKVISDPEFVAPLYQQARIAVVPMRLGSGTCIKSLEALAFGRPLVSTLAGAEGLGLVDGQHARIADTPEAFAQACLELLARPEERTSLGTAGLRHVESHFSWATCAALACELVSDPRPGHLRERTHQEG